MSDDFGEPCSKLTLYLHNGTIFEYSVGYDWVDGILECEKHFEIEFKDDPKTFAHFSKSAFIGWRVGYL